MSESPSGTPADATTLAPLSKEAVEAEFRSQSLRWSRDSDDDLHLFVNGSHFYVLLLGSEEDVLHVRGSWQRSLPSQLATDAAQFCLEWNRDKVFPKLYTRVDDTGRVRLMGEVSTDLTAGVAPVQLHYLVNYAFSTTLQAFGEADEHFPDTTVSTYPNAE